MSRESRYLEAILHHDIPLTRSMGLRVDVWENHELRLKVPLQANINHKSSMFGGSLYCAAVLAGWGWLHLRLREAGIDDGHIVIQDGRIEYPLPVVDDATAICNAPVEGAWERFEAIYRRRGRARLELHSRILAADGRDAVRFTGQYVLHK
ncbi:MULTISPECIES: thioesterase domain-containing protein [Stutzerimonas]|jgi:thioesterase domain-containing protein|uniref:Thioesterase n=2 Tax=Stutzerimonas balearica TaxID=74829 RepID=A0A8D3XXY6_9GAMM|nr:thioesterase domain-containing protein [Stutzerimonas balearica]KIL04222.1 thioesterase [Stutzerimonas stutzeri]MBB61742.1 thioesterase [Pseudomonas sp.]MBZ5754651.1 thioesterase domain-containing protein [Pseudomonas sp. S5(2021)]WIX03154.1 thioesterase domain-containing protein [Pseudomonas sp. AR5]AJE13785.1 thioesterase [Stutzerimonas balearica DSM 6083]